MNFIIALFFANILPKQSRSECQNKSFKLHLIELFCHKLHVFKLEQECNLSFFPFVFLSVFAGTRCYHGDSGSFAVVRQHGSEIVIF